MAFHVSAARNRESIAQHGVDWTRATGRGIAGSERPEGACVFLAEDEHEVAWWVAMSRERVDVWEVALPDDVEQGEINGSLCVLQPIPADRLRLLASHDPPPADDADSLATESNRIDVSGVGPALEHAEDQQQDHGEDDGDQQRAEAAEPVREEEEHLTALPMRECAKRVSAGYP